MSLKDVARDLYRAQQEVERLEDLLASARPEDEAGLREDLQAARAEHRYLSNIIKGRKKSTAFSRKF